MPIQTHSKAIWRESSKGGAVPDVRSLVFVSDGAGNITLASGSPEEFALYNTGDGNYTILPVTSLYADRLRAVSVVDTIQLY